MKGKKEAAVLWEMTFLQIFPRTLGSFLRIETEVWEDGLFAWVSFIIFKSQKEPLTHEPASSRASGDHPRPVGALTGGGEGRGIRVSARCLTLRVTSLI